jgi:hypothetical protein
MLNERVLSDLQNSLSVITHIEQLTGLFTQEQLRRLVASLGDHYRNPLYESDSPQPWFARSILRAIVASPSFPNVFRHQDFTANFDTEEFTAETHREILNVCLETGLLLEVSTSGGDQMYEIDDLVHTSISKLFENQSRVSV